MAWRAYFETGSGRLVSIGSVDPPEIPPGMAALDLPGQPNFDVEMWDEITRGFVARPARVMIDRFVEILTDPNFSDFQTVWNGLNTTRRNQLRAALVRLCGGKRWRRPNEPLFPFEAE